MASTRKVMAKWSRTAPDSVGTVMFGDQTEGMFDLDQLSPEIVTQLLWYGTKQKLADSGSDALTVGEFKDAVAATWARLMEGEFTASGGGSNVFLEAIARLKGVDVEQVRKAVNAANEEQVKKWKANPAIKSAMADISAERAKAKLAATKVEDEIEIDL